MSIIQPVFSYIDINSAKSTSYERTTHEVLLASCQGFNHVAGCLYADVHSGAHTFRYPKLRTRRKHRGVMPVKGYYTRARVFGYMIVVITLLYILYRLFI